METVPEAVWSDEPLSPKIREFAERLVDGVLGTAGGHRRADQEVRGELGNEAHGRDRPRYSAPGRLELLHEPDTPINVIINEALEIAKKYSTAESSKFVNGILDKIKLERK